MFKRIVFIAALACATLVVVDATQAMQRPADYNKPAHNVTTNEDPTIKIVHKRAGAKVQMGYFPNWYGSSICHGPSNVSLHLHRAIYSGLNFRTHTITLLEYDMS